MLKLHDRALHNHAIAQIARLCSKNLLQTQNLLNDLKFGVYRTFSLECHNIIDLESDNFLHNFFFRLMMQRNRSPYLCLKWNTWRISRTASPQHRQALQRQVPVAA